jgi:hypothetical protein
MPCSPDSAYSNTFDAYLHGMEICSGKKKTKKSPLYHILALDSIHTNSNTFNAYLHGMEICSGKKKTKKKVLCRI